MSWITKNVLLSQTENMESRKEWFKLMIAGITTAPMYKWKKYLKGICTF